MSKTHFGPISPQVYTLGPSPHVRLNLKKKSSLESVGHEILNKMRGSL